MDSPGEILSLCRLCLVKDQVNIPIFDEQGDIRQIFLKISSCLPVTITRHDQLPKRICDACSNKLDLLYEFWNSSASAEKTLLSWLGQAGVKDAGEKISAVAQQIAKPAETLVKEESESLEDSHMINESQDSFEDQSLDEGTKDEAEAPPPKRARRTAAVKAQINITPESDEDEDDDFDAGEAMTKIEDESDESESELKDDPSYSEVPGTSADDQAGPSGVGKDGVEAPLCRSDGNNSKFNLKKAQCYTCGGKFSSKSRLEHHLQQLQIEMTCKCVICQCSYSSDHCCNHAEANKSYHCEFCGIKIEQPFYFHLCFHLNSKKLLAMKQSSSKRHKREFPKRNNVKTKTNNGPVIKNEVDCDSECFEPVIDIGHCKFEKVTHRNHSDSDFDDMDTCIYCGKKMLAAFLLKHEAWHRKYDKHVKLLSGTQSSRLHGNNEGLCAYCGVIKPGNKLRRHEYVEHVKKNIRKVCDICGIFTCPTYIKEHMRTHDAVKGFKCEQCGKDFFRKKALARHKLVHTDVAQYMCTVCGKSFKIKFNLRVHMRSHEAVKPFPCSVCKKTFTTKQWRDNHLKTHGIVGKK